MPAHAVRASMAHEACKVGRAWTGGLCFRDRLSWTGRSVCAHSSRRSRGPRVSLRARSRPHSRAGSGPSRVWVERVGRAIGCKREPADRPAGGRNLARSAPGADRGGGPAPQRVDGHQDARLRSRPAHRPQERQCRRRLHHHHQQLAPAGAPTRTGGRLSGPLLRRLDGYGDARVGSVHPPGVQPADQPLAQSAALAARHSRPARDRRLERSRDDRLGRRLLRRRLLRRRGLQPGRQ